MENRQFVTGLSLIHGPSHLKSSSKNVKKRKYVFSLLRLLPLKREPEEHVSQMPTAPLHLPGSRLLSQFVYVNNPQRPLPRPRASEGEEQRHVMYPANVPEASSKMSAKATYTYIPAENKSKEVGVVDGLLGCAMLLLLAFLLLVVLYYLSS